MEQKIIDILRILPPIAQQEVLKFMEELAEKHQKVDDNIERDEKGWPIGFFEKTAGSWAGEPLVRAPQGELQERDALL